MRRILRKIAEDEFSALGDTSTLADPGVVDDLIDRRWNSRRPPSRVAFLICAGMWPCQARSGLSGALWPVALATVVGPGQPACEHRRSDVTGSRLHVGQHPSVVFSA
jgi:hypothetical protein